MRQLFVYSSSIFVHRFAFEPAAVASFSELNSVFIALHFCYHLLCRVFFLSTIVLTPTALARCCWLVLGLFRRNQLQWHANSSAFLALYLSYLAENSQRYQLLVFLPTTDSSQELLLDLARRSNFHSSAGCSTVFPQGYYW
jgi:hypothetical protein